MIEVRFLYNNNKEIYGFSVSNHGASIVCAAVSALTFNTVNAVEAFTDVDFCCETDEKGYIFFECGALKNGESCPDAALLLNALKLGIDNVSNEYRKSIRIKEVRLCLE
ncbi:hypothetical protein FACS1894188_12990 [Clostridia bacterium]|nr:hypothetical protein FACS1894188_12990 [Clostridia bacterium]